MCCSVTLHWENQLAARYLTITGAGFLISSCIPLPGNGYELRRMCKERRRGRLRSMQNKMENKFLRRWQRSWQADSDSLQPIDTAWLMYLCVVVCVCVRVYANASGEMILCGMLRPRSVGTSLGFHRYRSPGTRTDRQADGETVDHQGLVQRFSKLLSPNEQHIDPCLQVSKFQDSDPERLGRLRLLKTSVSQISFHK